MARGATVEFASPVRPSAQSSEKYFALKVRPVHELFAQTKHLLRDEIVHAGLRGAALLLREFRVVRRQAAQKSAHVFGAPVWQSQLRISIIELQVVANPAVSVEGDVLEKRAARPRLMTERAIQPLALHERHVVRLGEVPPMVELQRVRIAQLVGNHAKLGVVRREAVEDCGESVCRPRRFENAPSRVRTKIKRSSRH